jgi:hypothetical protein
MFLLKDGHVTFLRNIGTSVPHCMQSHSRRWCFATEFCENLKYHWNCFHFLYFHWYFKQTKVKMSLPTQCRHIGVVQIQLH